MVDVLGHGVEQAPGGAACRVQLATATTAFVQLLNLAKGALVGQLLRQGAGRAGFTEHIHEKSECLVPLDLAFGQYAHAVHEVVPLRDGDAELLLHRLRIETGVVRHLDSAAGAVQGDGQGVVAHHPNSGWGCSGG
ncbi:hypothetical protein D3C84_963630 [compost metagenome]